MFGFDTEHPFDIIGCVIVLIFAGYLLSWQIEPSKKIEPGSKPEPKENEDSVVEHHASTVEVHNAKIVSVTGNYNLASRTVVALVFTLTHVALYAIAMLLGPDWFYKKDQFPFKHEVGKNLATGLLIGGGFAWSLLVMHESWIDYHVKSRVLKLTALSSAHAAGFLVFAELAATLPSF